MIFSLRIDTSRTIPTGRIASSDKASFQRSYLLCLLFFLCPGIVFVGCGDGKPDKGADSDTSAAADIDSVGDEAIGDEVDAAGQTYTLKLSPKAGDVYGYQLVRQQNVATEGFKSSQQETYDFTLRVVSVNDDRSMVLGVTYNRVRATITAPTAKPDSTGKPILDSAGQVRLFEETIRFDTQGKENVPGGERYRAFVGRETLVTMDGAGKVQDVSNVDPILNATLKAMKVSPDTVNPRTLEIARQGIRLEIGTMISLVFFQLAPDSAVAVDASWTKSDSIPVAGLPAKAVYTSTLAGIRETDGERLAQVKSTLQTQLQLPKKNVENEYLSMKIEKIEVSGESEYLLGTATGFPFTKKSRLSVRQAGTGTAKVGPEKGKSQRVTYSESTVTSIRRLSYQAGV